MQSASLICSESAFSLHRLVYLQKRHHIAILQYPHQIISGNAAFDLPNDEDMLYSTYKIWKSRNVLNTK